jgi:hypothetical protein
MSFDPFKAPIDYVLLAGRRSPGIAELERAGSPRTWDERKGFGLSGATTIFRGVRLAHFILKLRLYTSEQFAEWATFSEIVKKPPLGERPKQLEIWHPILEDLGITACGVEDVKQPVQTRDGEWTIEIPLIEYRKLTPALSRPDGAQARPVDPVDQHIEQLAAQVQALSAL